MKIKKLDIKKFRHMENLEVQFGDYLTVISGLNGTGKSSILGLVGQLFDYKGKEKTKDAKKFATKYSEIFTFCPVHDQNQKYQYKAIIDDDGDSINKRVRSRFIKKEKRFRLDIGHRGKAGESAIDYPVIYLGLRRLFPLAQEEDTDIKIQPLTLNDNEVSFYNREAKEIFVSLLNKLSPESVKTPNKEFYAVETPDYGSLGNSAGQDNIGQLLTAILSFRSLKKGGILLIDELDATLFAGAQINLIDRLYSYARKFELQIIFTTHSLEIINFLNEKPEWGTKINFLELSNKKVKNTIDPKLDYIQSRILLQTRQEIPLEKVNILCEDRVAELWCKNLLNSTEIKNHVNIYGTEISDGGLADMASKNLKCFKNFLFVLDGDCSRTDRFQGLRNVVFLPGRKRAETIFYNFLRNLSDDDEFWGGQTHFYQETCFRNFASGTSKSAHKRWLVRRWKNFGKGLSKLLNKWKRDNISAKDHFIVNIEQKISRIVKK